MGRHKKDYDREHLKEKDIDFSKSELNERLFNHKLNEIKLMVSGATLNFLDRGKIYSEFKGKTGLTDYQLAGLIGKSRSFVSKELRVYGRALERGITSENKPDIPDKYLIGALEIKDEHVQDLILEHVNDFPNIKFNKLCSIMNRKLDVDEYIESVKKQHQLQLTELEKLKQLMDKLNPETKYIKKLKEAVA